MHYKIDFDPTKVRFIGSQGHFHNSQLKSLSGIALYYTFDSSLHEALERYTCAAATYLANLDAPLRPTEYMAVGSTTISPQYAFNAGNMGCYPMTVGATFTWDHAALSLVGTELTFAFSIEIVSGGYFGKVDVTKTGAGDTIADGTAIPVAMNLSSDVAATDVATRDFTFLFGCSRPASMTFADFSSATVNPGASSTTSVAMPAVTFDTDRNASGCHSLSYVITETTSFSNFESAAGSLPSVSSDKT